MFLIGPDIDADAEAEADADPQNRRTKASIELLFSVQPRYTDRYAERFA